MYELVQFISSIKISSVNLNVCSVLQDLHLHTSNQLFADEVAVWLTLTRYFPSLLLVKRPTYLSKHCPYFN